MAALVEFGRHGQIAGSFAPFGDGLIASSTRPLASLATWLHSCFYMDHQDWTINEKPYDLRERLFLFACIVVRVVQFLHTRGPVAIALSAQLLKSGTSAGANYEEADDGSSPRDSLAKKRIVFRELKETNFRLRVLRRAGFLIPAQDPVIEESAELVRIVATIVRNSSDADG